MFGLRGLRNGPSDDKVDTVDVPYSRFSGTAPDKVPSRNKYSRFEASKGTNRRLPVERNVEPAETVPSTELPPHNPIADLYSEAPIPASVLHRALPNRFRRMELHAIRTRRSLRGSLAEDFDLGLD